MKQWLSILYFLVYTVTFADDAVRLEASPGKYQTHILPDTDPSIDSFAVNLEIDPVEANGGDNQVVCGLKIGMGSEAASVNDPASSTLTVDLREGTGRAAYRLWHRDKIVTVAQPTPTPPGWVNNRQYQHPNILSTRDRGGYKAKLVVWPEESGSRVRIFINAFDRPKEDHFFEDKITAGVIKLFTMRGGSVGEPTRISRFSKIGLEKLSVTEAQTLPSHWETVIGALDLSYQPLIPVAQAIEKQQLDEAKSLFIRHMRTRQKPQGATWDQVPSTVLHPDYRKISDAILANQFATIGYFDGFVEAWKDTDGDTHQWVIAEDPLQINWARDNGHLNRHFHWVSLAKTWQETGDNRYAKRFSDEVFDWVSREPFFWDRTPTIGGLNIMDGTIFRWGYMNTSNIGRRLELTWWPAYEVFRKSSEFSDEAHFAMLVGMIRQAELITNPTSFAVHDDGAAHTTMALLQTALMLPEFKASKLWKEIALERWDEMLAKQFHPDGSHVSLSTGYNWATILTLENFIRLLDQLGTKAPQKYFDLLERALEHPISLSTPSQSQIPLNDGGWSMVDDHYRRTLEWFPHREDFKWIATKGKAGSPPEKKSLYLPNAGQFVMRTGWGKGEQFLFFGAGPWGASHGKQDALNIFAQFGNHLLIRNAGRGSYSGVGNTVHAGRSLSFNTLSPDWAQENSIPHWKTEMHIGFYPPNRRWISNDDFDYGEGAFNYGWHRSGEHIKGKWIRQIIFVKGNHAKSSGYYLAIDTVEPEDNIIRTWRHPWQLNPDSIEIRESDHSVVAKNSAALLKITPIDPSGTTVPRMIQGQEKPELLGWRVHDKTAKPWPVPTFEWQANSTFCRGWLIQMQASEANLPVASIETLPSHNAGELRFKIHRKNDVTDEVIRRIPDSQSVIAGSGKTEADVTVISRNADDQVIATLEIQNGTESVAALPNR